MLDNSDIRVEQVGPADALWDAGSIDEANY